MEKQFDLLQVHTNPRDNSTFTTHFDTYPTLALAKKPRRN